MLNTVFGPAHRCVNICFDISLSLQNVHPTLLAMGQDGMFHPGRPIPKSMAWLEKEVEEKGKTQAIQAYKQELEAAEKFFSTELYMTFYASLGRQLRYILNSKNLDVENGAAAVVMILQVISSSTPFTAFDSQGFEL